MYKHLIHRTNRLVKLTANRSILQVVDSIGSRNKAVSFFIVPVAVITANIINPSFNGIFAILLMNDRLIDGV